MEVTMKEAEALVPVSRTTLYNDKKAGIFSVKQNAKGRTVIDVSELQRVYGELNLDQTESGITQKDKSEQSSSNKNPSAGGAGEIEALKKQVEILENANKREREIYEAQIEHLKETLSAAQDSQKQVTRLLEHHTEKENGAGQWEQQLAALEMRLANREEADKEREEREKKILEENKRFKQAYAKQKKKIETQEQQLITEKNKNFIQKLFG